jgi:hypothetical protein
MSCQPPQAKQRDDGGLVGGEPYGDAGAKRELAELALRMQRCGVSRWHPDPLAACERAEAKQQTTAK